MPVDPGADRLSWILALALGFLALSLYARTFSFDFVQLDDARYVWQNSYLANGLTPEFLRFSWSFSPEAIYQGVSNWHPLTWLSYGLDVSLFGVDSGAMHRTNAILHALNGVLVFFLFSRTTRAPLASALVASLFIVHPLHVEAVAWIAERKEVLSTAFGLLACHAWVGFVRARPGQHATVWLAFALVAHAASLLSKPMWVTLPFLLLALDVWPLRRNQVPIARRLTEKLPFVGVSLASGLVTLFAQRDALNAASSIPLASRIANVPLALVEYLRLTIWPIDLSILYPHPYLPGGHPPGLVEWAIVCIVLASLITLAWLTRREPIVASGLAWFVISLGPVVGLIQVGEQAYADRYTYVALVGPFAAAVFFSRAWLQSRPVPIRLLVAGLALFAVCALTTRAYDQTGVWRDTVSLYESARESTPNSVHVRFNLGNRLMDLGREAEAIAEYEMAAELRPDWADPLTNLAWLLATTSDKTLVDGERAVALSSTALARQPNNANTLDTLAAAYAAAGDFTAAVETARQAVDRARKDGHPGRARDYARRAQLFSRSQRFVVPREAPAESGRSSSSPSST